MKIVKTLSKWRPVLLLVMLLVLGNTAFSQDPGDPPDGPPPAVPIEDYMHLIILAAGGVLAYFTIGKLKKKQA